MILFFDGYCVLCNSAVYFLFRVDKKQKLKFSPLQGKAYAELQIRNPSLPKNIGSIVVWQEGKYHLKSNAILESLIYIGGFWSVMAKMGKLMPISLRDWLYDFVAENRYKWFGKNESCRFPTAEEKSRFLD